MRLIDADAAKVELLRQVYKIDDYADIDRSDGCPLLGVIVVNEPDSKPVIYLR